MANIAIFRINYKSDFILTLKSDAGWMTPFCMKFWTGAPSMAFFAGFDGTTYTHCTPVEGDPTKLVVQFDDHALPVGNLKFQVAYHFTVDDFPNNTEDEVINPADIIIEIDGVQYQVMLDFTGETAPEIEFSLPAYANEEQRIANEEERIAHEQQRIAQENERVSEFATIKAESEVAIGNANDAASLANTKAQLASEKAAIASAAATNANNKAVLAQAAASNANDKAAIAQAAAVGAEKVNAELDGTTLTVTNRQGSSRSVNTKGETGPQGPVGPMGPASEADININGTVITVKNNAGAETSVDMYQVFLPIIGDINSVLDDINGEVI